MRPMTSMAIVTISALQMNAPVSLPGAASAGSQGLISESVVSAPTIPIKNDTRKMSSRLTPGNFLLYKREEHGAGKGGNDVGAVKLPKQIYQHGALTVR